MSHPNTQFLNNLLREVNIDSSYIEVLSYSEKNDKYRVRFSEDGKTSEKEIYLDTFIADANAWVQLNRDKKGPSFPKHTWPFHRISYHNMWIDTDPKQLGPEVISLFDKESKTWQRFEIPSHIPVQDRQMLEVFMQRSQRFRRIDGFDFDENIVKALKNNSPIESLIEFAKKLSWNDFWLAKRLDAEGFSYFSYAFHAEAPADASKPLVIGPTHQITLAKPKDKEADVKTKATPVIIPWSDPALLKEWHAYLINDRLVTFEASAPINEAPTNIKYYYKGLLWLEVDFTPKAIHFSYYNPLGGLDRKEMVPIPELPPIQVTMPSLPDKQGYFITVHGMEMPVDAYFPHDLEVEQRKSMLAEIGEWLQRIPPKKIKRFIDGINQEKPVRLFLSTMEQAQDHPELGELFKKNKADHGGKYFSEHNIFWIRIIKLELENKNKYQLPVDGTAIHELVGHGGSDFYVSDDNAAKLTHKKDNPFTAYHGNSLEALFSAERLKAYDDAFMATKSSNTSQEEKKRANALLQHYQAEVKTKFPSTYAVETSYGVRSGFSGEETLADSAEAVYSDDIREWPAVRSGPAYIFLLDRLFEQYGVDKIGNVRRDKLFTAETFEEVLKVKLKDPNPYYDEVHAKFKNLSTIREGLRSRLGKGNWNTNLLLQTRFRGRNPEFGVGMELEIYGRNWGDTLTVYSAFPYFSYSFLGNDKGLRDHLGIGMRYYNEGNFSHEVGLDIEGLLPESVIGQDNLLTVGAHYALRFPVKLFGNIKETGPYFGGYISPANAKICGVIAGWQVLLP